MTTQRTIHTCEICRRDYSSLELAQRCEAQGPPPNTRLEPGTWVKLDARGLKRGPLYVRARVVSYEIYAGYRVHEDHVPEHEICVVLDREVHLVDVWGEGGDGNYMQRAVDVDLILPEDLSTAPTWDLQPAPPADAWTDATEKYSYRYPYMVKAYPEDVPWPTK